MYPNLNTGNIGIQATLEETIALARKHGFAGVDFSISEAADLVDAHGIEYVRDLFSSAGVKPGSWDFPIEFRRDEATWREGIETLPRLAGVAQALGCVLTATWIVPCSNKLEFQRNFEQHVSRLQPAAKILDDHGCRLGLEFVGPKTLRDTQQYPFIYTMSGVLDLCRAIGTENMGLLLDCYHIYTSHGSNADIRQLSNKQVVTVHVNDAPAGLAVDEQLDLVRTLPGETGVIDIAGFLQELQAIGYNGPVTAEPFSKRINNLSPDVAVAETALAMEKIWQMAGL